MSFVFSCYIINVPKLLDNIQYWLALLRRESLDSLIHQSTEPLTLGLTHFEKSIYARKFKFEVKAASSIKNKNDCQQLNPLEINLRNGKVKLH